MTVKVKLREKNISKGRKSLYLDFYPAIRNPNTGKDSRREFLGLYVFQKPKNASERQHNKDVRNLAQSICNQRFSEIQNGIYGFRSDAKKRKSFIDFFESLVKQKYTSKGNYDNWLSSFRYFSEYFNHNLTMGELSENLLDEFRQHLLILPLAQNTKLTYFNKVRAAVKQAFRKGLIPENYAQRVDGIKEAETKREFLTIEELQKVAKTECEKPIIKRAFLFSAFTGLRFSDIEKLKWKDLQFSEDLGYFIRVRQKKTQSEITLQIPKPALLQIENFENQNPNQKIFKGLKYSAWNNLKLKEWIMRAGIIKNITFHCARHSFATNQLAKKTDMATVSKMLGHKDIRTTMIYAKVVNASINEAMDKFNDIEL